MVYHTTLNGLEMWSRHMFEHVGWMILAKRDKRNYKVVAYKKSLAHLRKALEERLTITQDADRINDLKELHFNIMTLVEFVKKNL
jgi:hypothetical protein